VHQRAAEVLKTLKSDRRLSHFVDPSLGISEAYHGGDTIRLIILGQDPTVKNPASRLTIRTTLNLDKAGSLRNYVCNVCNNLDLDLENVYATNYLKNFFTAPPTQITELDVFKEFGPYWLPLLKDELAQFPDVPVISLGQPLLGTIVTDDTSPLVRDYWGYVANWKSGEQGPFSSLAAEDNILGRAVYPFPHQPGIGKRFYAERLKSYCAFMKRRMRKTR
jgi:hypothetical protein